MKRGRKPKGEFSGKSETFTTRITPETKRALTRAAKANGRSLSQEVERRLAQSLKDEGTIIEKYGDLRTAAFFRLLSLTVRLLGQYGAARRKFWLEDRYQYVQVAEAVRFIFDVLEPSGPRRVRGESDPEFLGALMGGTAIQAVKAAGKPDPHEHQDLKDALESTFEEHVETAIHQALGNYLERTPDNFFLGAVRRRIGGTK